MMAARVQATANDHRITTTAALGLTFQINWVPRLKVDQTSLCFWPWLHSLKLYGGQAGSLSRSAPCKKILSAQL
jgi:hypothetical protein